MGKFSEEKVARILAFAAMLAERHPKAFPSGKPGNSSIVLKVGIHFDIYALYPDIPKRTVHSLMSWHTRSPKYLEAASIAGTSRLDLDGETAGEVTEEQAKAAQVNLATRKARSKAAKAAARKLGA